MIANLTLGQIIGGRYQIVQELGRGAFGKTYLAEDIQIPGKPKCVVKQFKPMAQDSATLDVAKRLFVQEAEVLSKIGNDHSQIPRLLAYYPEELCLIQEFIAGKDLRQEILPEQKLPEGEVIKILKDILKVLVFIHGENVIHRDIKPSNVIRRAADGKLVLIDFGAVKEISSIQTNVHGETRVTVAIGTPGFMPSEQQVGRPCFSSDIYALGVMAMEALTGISPTKLQEDERFGKELLLQECDVSKKLAAVIDKMVRVDWRERYQSAQEVLKDLESLNHWKLPQFNLKRNKKIPLPLLLASFVGLVGAAYLVIPPALTIYYYSKGKSLFEKKQFVDAITEYDKAISIYPNAKNAWLHRGYAFSKLKQFDQMLDSCQKAVEVSNPEFIHGLNCMALALQELDRGKEAIAIYNKLIALKPNDYRFWYNKGEVQLKEGLIQEALESFKQATVFKPDYHFAWNGWGNALVALGKANLNQPDKAQREKAKQYWREAIEIYTRAIEIKPDYEYAWLGRGNAKRLLKEYSSALQDYEQAIVINPEYYEAYYNKALTYDALNDCQAALDALNKAIRIRPGYTAAINKREQIKSRNNCPAQ
ncbi:MAG: tetratricopeptide repeat protein [Cyanobacteria bacterium J083]|nr:MAG: tetratricopeptide repeat protein [Cyanobacteria bacterium J083]